MAGRHCAISGCSNGDYKLCRWRKEKCRLHDVYFGCCYCPPPFELFMFPKDEEDRRRWIQLINRRTEDSGKLWTPTKMSRVCSVHFVDGQPSCAHPDPELVMGSEQTTVRKRRSQTHSEGAACQPKVRSLSPPVLLANSPMTAGSESHSVADTYVADDLLCFDCSDHTYSFNCVGAQVLLQTQVVSNPFVSDDLSHSVSNDHTYSSSYVDCQVVPDCFVSNDMSSSSICADHTYSFGDCEHNMSCMECTEKDKLIADLQTKIRELESRKDASHLCTERVSPKTSNNHNILRFAKPHNKGDMSTQFVKTDKLVKKHTGLSSRAVLNRLYLLVKPKAGHMRYWVGARRSVLYYKRSYTHSPKKPGCRRHLSVKDELVLVLMKIRLGLTNSFLSCLFRISVGSCSCIFNTWVKFLANQLQNFVFWPEKELIKQTIPNSLKSVYPNLRCTIDCSETFIQRPRDLYLQATTWSDYKQHNTLKFLVAIAPDGLISFVSCAWGGRATDRYIVQQSGFLNLVDPGDVILADRGFPIQEDLLFKQATLVIPPPGSGKLQMTKDNVKKTKKVANARIHVERAINRMKWFKLLSNVLPVSLIPVFDNILVICAALCNLLGPLVK